MAKGSGISRGDRNRNARLTRLRALVSVDNATAATWTGPAAWGRTGSNGPYDARSPGEAGSSPHCGSPAPCSPP